VPYEIDEVRSDEMIARARAIFEEADKRRSVRQFSDRAVPRQAIEYAIATASTAPSGAHRQPWTFVLVGDAAVKRQIREAAEAEERQNYLGGRMNEEWQEALRPLGTGWEKPFLETVPWIVVVFEQRYSMAENNTKQHNYYVKESVGIACGMFIDALHRMGLATLTHTPSPMRFLTELLDRPANERPFILFPIGYPAGDAMVPNLERKTLDKVLVEITDPAEDPSR
jgi:nitroreductase